MGHRRRPEPGPLPGVGLQRKTQHVGQAEPPGVAAVVVVGAGVGVEPPGGGGGVVVGVGVGVGPGTLLCLGLQRATQNIRQAEPEGGVGGGVGGGVVPAETGTGVAPSAAMEGGSGGLYEKREAKVTGVWW